MEVVFRSRSHPLFVVWARVSDSISSIVCSGSSNVHEGELM